MYPISPAAKCDINATSIVQAMATQAIRPATKAFLRILRVSWVSVLSNATMQQTPMNIHHARAAVACKEQPEQHQVCALLVQQQQDLQCSLHGQRGQGWPVQAVVVAAGSSRAPCVEGALPLLLLKLLLQLLL